MLISIIITITFQQFKLLRIISRNFISQITVEETKLWFKTNSAT